LKRKNVERGFGESSSKKKKLKLDKVKRVKAEVKESKSNEKSVKEEGETTKKTQNGAKSKQKKRKDLREKRKKLNLKKNKIKFEIKEANLIKKKKKSQKSNSTSKISLHVENDAEIESSFDENDFETSNLL
jgi:hypothetical protein